MIHGTCYILSSSIVTGESAAGVTSMLRCDSGMQKIYWPTAEGINRKGKAGGRNHSGLVSQGK